jgi:hypothetical protein
LHFDVEFRFQSGKSKLQLADTQPNEYPFNSKPVILVKIVVPSIDKVNEDGCRLNATAMLAPTRERYDRTLRLASTGSLPE